MSKKELLQNISEAKPKSARYFVIKNIFTALALLFLSLFSILAIATFLRDLFVLNISYDIFGNLPWEIAIHGLIELVAIGIMLLVICYIIYRHTDWPLVRHERFLASIFVLLMITGGGIAAFTSGLHKSLDSNRDFIQQLPYRQNRGNTIETRLRNRGVIVGIVDSISMNQQTITVRTPKDLITLQYRDIPNELQVGDTIRANVKKEQIISIKKVPRFRPSRK